MRVPTPHSSSAVTPSRCGTTTTTTIAPPHRLRQPASRHPRPSTRHQRHDLIHLGHPSAQATSTTTPS